MNLFFLRKNKIRAFALIEILVSVSIISVSIFTIISVSTKSIELSRLALDRSRASFLLEEGANVLKILRYVSFDNISNLETETNYYLVFNNNTWSVSDNIETIDNFERRFVVSDVYRGSSSGEIEEGGEFDEGTKKITVFVSWFDGKKEREENLSFFMSNIFE